MHERTIEIYTADRRMETFITHPEQGGPFARVVVYMDVWGLREELYDIAHKVAVVGYYVVLPDYYRQGRIRYQWCDAQSRSRAPSAGARGGPEAVGCDGHRR